MAGNTHQELRRALGQRLRELRLDAGITSQEKLAEKAGVHRTYVGRVERGESGITLDSLSAILVPLKVDLATFFRPFTTIFKARSARHR